MCRSKFYKCIIIFNALKRVVWINDRIYNGKGGKTRKKEVFMLVLHVCFHVVNALNVHITSCGTCIWNIVYTKDYVKFVTRSVKIDLVAR